MGKEDPVLPDLMAVEQDGEQDGEDNDHSGREVGCISVSSEEVLRSRILCDPDLQRPEMRLALTEVKQAQCSGQSEGDQHVDKSPVPVQRHPLTLVYLTKSEVAKDWKDDKGWVVDNQLCCIPKTSQRLVEGGEGNDCT